MSGYCQWNQSSWRGRLSKLKVSRVHDEGSKSLWSPACTGINKTWAQAGCPPVPVGKAHHYPNIPAEERSFKKNKFRAGSATA